MDLLLSNIITAIFLFFAGLWLKNFLPNYFNEKGKLLAQKEDIEEITEKIEGVKTEFTKETELLKASLQRLINLETSHRNEERNCIIEFYGKYNQWLWALMEINYGSYNRQSLKELIEKRSYLEKFYAETNVAQSKVRLLVKDGDIVSLSHKLMLAILEFKSWFDVQLLGLQQTIENQIFLTERFSNLINKFEENKQEAYKLAQEEKEIHGTLRKMVTDFYATKVTEYKKTIGIDNLFTEKVKDYLTK